MTRNLRTLSVAEVHARTGFPRTKIRSLVRAGRLAVIRESERGHLRILESSLEALFDDALQRQQSAAPQQSHITRVEDDVDAAVLPTDRPRAFA